MIRYAILAAGVAVLAYGVHRIMQWMERKGWVYYQHGSGSGNMGTALMPLQSIYQPEVRYVIDERARIEAEAEQDDSGEPPNREEVTTLRK